MHFVSSLLTILYVAGRSTGQQWFQPEQVHIALGNSFSEMSVTWVTLSQLPPSAVPMVQYGKGVLSSEVNGTTTVFTDGGPAQRVSYIHRVLLTNLEPLQNYIYHCGSAVGWSDLYFFKSPSPDPAWLTKFAVFGDLGNSNAQSLARLQQETQLGHFQAILHVGDFAYDLMSNNGLVGDEFMRQIESVAAYIPYMTCVGNHEQHYYFKNYKNRFTMPGNTSNMYYSFDYGRAHIISFSSEFYFYNDYYGYGDAIAQYKWLEQDLIKANKPENRAARPWIITMAHRPMYCSNRDGDDCTKFESVVRTGGANLANYGLESLFYKYGVDLTFWAHEHSYERLWPLYNRTVCNGTGSPYNEPPAPVHIITGSAGCSEDHDPFGPVTPFTAARTSDYGYSRLTVYNSTHLFVDYVSDDKDGLVIDETWIIRRKHGMGQFSCHAKAPKNKQSKDSSKDELNTKADHVVGDKLLRHHDLMQPNVNDKNDEKLL